MGKGGDKNENKGGDRVELLINDRYYDVTDMKHPGGSVIKFYAGKGIDATDAFSNFHVRSQRAQKYLASLPSRPLEGSEKKEYESGLMKGQAELMKDFRAFQQQLEEEGYFKPSPLHIAYRVAEIIIMHAVGFYFLFNGYVPLGVVVLGIVSGRCGWLMHEGGHNSLTGNIFVDQNLQMAIYGLGCGMSGAWWRTNHNKHHSMPQKIGHDVDLRTLPLVAFTQKVCSKVGFTQKMWLRYQAYLFPIITTTLVALGWQFFLHPQHVARIKNKTEAFYLVLRYVLWTAFVTARFGLATSTLLYLAYTWVGANYIFINFAVSHTHLPTVPKEDTQVDWIRYAAVHTMNAKPGPLNFVNWWMSYLNFQIEHHLFPSMPQYRFPELSPRVKAFFEKHNLVYDSRTYTDAMIVTFQNLDKVGADVFHN